MTLLELVNEVLIRGRLIQGDSADLTSLTSGSFQNDINITVSAINEVIRYCYDHDNEQAQFPFDTAEGTITLVDGTREYALAAAFEKFSNRTMVDQTNGYYITEYVGGYNQMFIDQPQPSSYTGRPQYWVINPTDEMVRFDRTPTASEDGDIYTYLYEKALYFSLAAETFPFSDQVARLMVPAIKLVWQRETKKTFDEAQFNIAIGQCVQLLSNAESRSTY